MSTVNFNGVETNLVELESALVMADKRTIDVKIQELVKSLETISSSLKNDILTLYEKSGISHMQPIPGFHTFRGSDWTTIKNFDQDIYTIISKALPNIGLNSQLNQLETLNDVLDRARISRDSEELKKMLKDHFSNPGSNLEGGCWITAPLWVNLNKEFSIHEESRDKSKHRFDMVKLLLQYGAKITEENKKQLFDFLIGNCLSFIDNKFLELLMSRGFDINTDGTKLLKEFQVKNNSWAKSKLCFDIVKLLLQYGAKITEENKKELFDFLAGNCVHFMDNEFIELLMSRGFDLNADGTKLYTAGTKLFNERNFGDFTFKLLSYGAEISQESEYLGELRSIREDALRELMRVFPCEKTQERLSQEEVLRSLPANVVGTIAQYQPLIDLAHLTLPQRRELSKLCRDVKDFREVWQRVCWPHEAADRMKTRVETHKKFINALKANDFETARYLLKEGIDVNAPLYQKSNGQYEPLLVTACRYGNLKLVKFLLAAGANPNVYGCGGIVNGCSAFSFPPILAVALSAHSDSRAIMDLLIKYGADVNQKDRCGCPLILNPYFQQSVPVYGTYPFEMMLRNLIRCGLDINSKYNGQGLWPNLNLPHDKDGQRARCLIFYGYETSTINISQLKNLIDVNRDDKAMAIVQAIEIRDKVISEMTKEGLLKEEALKSVSPDVAGIIAGYQSYSVEHLTPELRLQLADRCYAKYGYETSASNEFNLNSKVKAKAASRSDKIREEVIAEMTKEGLLKEDTLKSMSSDVVGIIAGYQPYAVENLTPELRLQFAYRCHAKFCAK